MTQSPHSLVESTSNQVQSPPKANIPDSSLLIIGTGSVGYRHLMNASALGVSRLSVLRTGLGVKKNSLPTNVAIETDLDRALSNGITAVVVANPTSLHVQSALAAARVGCHLLVEKPLSHELSGVDDLVVEVRKRNLVAMVGYQFRFHPSIRQVHRWLQEDAIGEVVHARVSWGEYLPEWQPWRDYRTSYSARADLGGGVLLTLSHPIDYLRWLLGDVGRVSAMTSRRGGLDIDVEDTALVHLEFSSGALASLVLDYVRRPIEHHLTIVGRKGVIRWDYSDGAAVIEGPDRQSIRNLPNQFERNDMFLAEMHHFLNCIAGREQPFCSIADGAQTLRVCLAALESSGTGRSIDV